jgi:hypothetical protein
VIDPAAHCSHLACTQAAHSGTDISVKGCQRVAAFFGPYLSFWSSGLRGGPRRLACEQSGRAVGEAASHQGARCEVVIIVKPDGCGCYDTRLPPTPTAERPKKSTQHIHSAKLLAPRTQQRAPSSQDGATSAVLNPSVSAIKAKKVYT